MSRAWRVQRARAYSAASSYASSSAASRAGGSRARSAPSLARAAAAPLPRYVEQSPGGRSAASSVAASLVEESEG